MLKNIKALLLLACFFLLSALSAQTDSCNYVLHGKVIDSDTKTSLELASVTIVELNLSVMTDSLGNYRLTRICEGSYIIQVNHPGCHPVKQKIYVSRNEVLDFLLPHSAHRDLHEVVCVAKAVENSSQPKEEINGKQLLETRGETLGEALKKANGVTTLQTGSSISKPMIHGLHSSRLLILNNGIRQEGQQWGSEHAPEIDPFIAQQLTVIKGPGTVRYGGDAIAGLILIEPNPLRDSAGIGGEINLVGFSNGRQGIASAIVDGNFKRIPPFSWRIQGTLKSGGNLQTPRYYLANTGVREYNFSFALGYQKEKWGATVFYSQFNTRLGIFTGSHIGNLTDLKAAFSQIQPADTAVFSYAIDRPYQQILHELFKANAYIRTGVRSKLSLTYARQFNDRREYDRHKPLNDSLAALNLPELRYKITTHLADLVWEHSNIRALKGSMGISGLWQANTYRGRLFIPNFENGALGAFVSERLIKTKYELEAGIRYDIRRLQVFTWENNLYIQPQFHFQNFSGGLGAIFKLFPGMMISCNLGSAWRAPGVNELFSNGLHHGAAAIEIGDRSLQSERSYQATATVNYHQQKWDAEVSIYYNHIFDFIYLHPDSLPALTIRGAFPSFHYNQADVILKGIDASAKYTFDEHWTLHGRASLLRAFNQKMNDWLIMMPADRYEGKLSYSLKDKGKWKKPGVSLTIAQVMKQWRVPSGIDFAPPPGAYTLVHLNIVSQLMLGKNIFSIQLHVNNLLNKAYRDYTDRFRYYSDAIGRNVSVKLNYLF